MRAARLWWGWGIAAWLLVVALHFASYGHML